MFTMSADLALIWESAPEEDGDHFQGLGNCRQIATLARGLLRGHEPESPVDVCRRVSGEQEKAHPGRALIS